jgi:DNA polymerase-3 subunit epsilon
MAQLAVLGETPFAVVDVESTGIYPSRHDRIVEIAVVRLSPTLEIEEEWHTLVNPRRDIGRTDIHGIRAGDVLRAPGFSDIAADVAIRLRDSVVVGHHLRFDVGFLAAEYDRAGIRLPQLPGLCTLDLAYQLLPDTPSRKLVYCCEQAGIRHEDEHTALGDARATAALLDRFIAWGQERQLTTLEALGCKPLRMPAATWLDNLTATGKRLPREQAVVAADGDRAYLARLVERMLGDEARNPREAEYLALVDRALQDRRVMPDEAEMLRDMAESWGMTRSDVLEAHRLYLGGLTSQALADGQVTDMERHDLETVCDALGLHRAALDVLLADAPTRRQARPTTEPQALRGNSVCFTGEMLGTYRGERITREVSEKLAAEAGLEIRQSVTKRLDLLVVADPDTQSIKARKAREYGVRIMADQVFWRALGIPVEFGRPGAAPPDPPSAPPARTTPSQPAPQRRDAPKDSASGRFAVAQPVPRPVTAPERPAGFTLPRRDEAPSASRPGWLVIPVAVTALLLAVAFLLAGCEGP